MACEVCGTDFELWTDRASGMSMWKCPRCGNIKIITGEI